MADTEKRKEQLSWAMRVEREPMASGQWAMREEEARPVVRRQWAMREEEPPRRINEGEDVPEAAGAEIAPSVQEYNPDDPRERRLRQLRDMYKGDINKDMLKSLHRRVEKVESRQEQPVDEPNERLERNETPRSIFDEARGAK